jgi:hypothetical protein
MRGSTAESHRLVAEAKEIAVRTRDGWLARAVAMHETASLRLRGAIEELVLRQDELRAAVDVFPDYAAAFDAMLGAQQDDANAASAALSRLDRAHVRVCMCTMMATWVAEAAVVAQDAGWGAIAEEVLAQHAHEWVSWSGIAFIVESPVARGRALAATARGDVDAARAFFGEALMGAEGADAGAIIARLRAEAAAKAAARAPGPAASASEVISSITLKCDGEYWTVCGAGRTIRLKDSRGMHMLAALVAASGREQHVLELANIGEPHGVIDTGDAGELLDQRARDAYRGRLTELTRELEEAEAHNDSGRLERLRAESEALTAELSRSVALGGRARRAGAAAERARVNVQRRLTEAIRRIEEAHAPLGLHLRQAIRTGMFCSYAPERAARKG